MQSFPWKRSTLQQRHLGGFFLQAGDLVINEGSLEPKHCFFAEVCGPWAESKEVGLV